MWVFISSWIICWEFCCCFWICSASDCIALSHSCRAPSGDCFTLSIRPSVISSPYSMGVPDPFVYRTRNRAGERRTRIGLGGWTRPYASRSKALALGVVGPYLAVDLLEEGLAVLMVLLELAHLPQLLGREALDPLRDLLHGQPFVVGGLQRSQHGGPQLSLAGDLLGLAHDVLGPLGGLLGYPKTLAGGLLGRSKPLPCYLLGGLKPLLGGPLEGPHALLHVGEWREELPVGPDPTPAKSPHALLLPEDTPREGLGGVRVVLGLLAHNLDGVTHPALHELGVALLELKEPQAVGEELLGRPGVIFLEPHELEPAFGDPDGAALGCGEVLGYGFEGVVLSLCHLSGGARCLVDVCCGGHCSTSMVDSKSLLLCSYHTYVRCKPHSIRPFVFAPIHRSAWNRNSPESICRILDKTT